MFPPVVGLDPSLVGSALLAVSVFVLAENADDIVARVVSSDDPLTDFDADLDDAEDDSTESLNDV